MSSCPRLAVASSLLLAAAFAGCGNATPQQDAAASSAQPAAVAPNVVAVSGHEYAFDAPDTIPAGLTTFQFTDAGKELHHMQLVKLDAGKTVADLLAVFKAGPPPPAWAHFVGGVNAPRPGGGEASATLMVAPGNYAIVCVIPDAHGVPHVMQGMMKALTVVPSSGPVAAAPTADDTIQMSDYSYTLSSPLTAGKHTLEIVNDGPQDHEIQLVLLAPGKTAADVAEWVNHQQGPPPGLPLGGVPEMAPGEHAFITVDLKPGNYALLCFVPDAKDGQPHVAHGMMKQITVT